MKMHLVLCFITRWVKYISPILKKQLCKYPSKYSGPDQSTTVLRIWWEHTWECLEEKQKGWPVLYYFFKNSFQNLWLSVTSLLRNMLFHLVTRRVHWGIDHPCACHLFSHPITSTLRHWTPACLPSLLSSYYEYIEVLNTRVTAISSLVLLRVHWGFEHLCACHLFSRPIIV